MSVFKDSYSQQEHKYDDEDVIRMTPAKENPEDRKINLPSAKSDISLDQSEQNNEKPLQDKSVSESQSNTKNKDEIKNDGDNSKSKALSYAQTVANGLTKNEDTENIRVAPGGIAFDVDCTDKVVSKTQSSQSYKQYIKHILHQHELEHHLQKFLRNQQRLSKKKGENSGLSSTDDSSQEEDPNSQAQLPQHGYSMSDLSSLMQLLQCNRGHYARMLTLRRKSQSKHHDSQEINEDEGEIDGFLEEFFYNQQRITQLVHEMAQNASTKKIPPLAAKNTNNQRFYQYSELIDAFPSLLSAPLPPHVDHDANDPVSSVLEKDRYDAEEQDLLSDNEQVKKYEDDQSDDQQDNQRDDSDYQQQRDHQQQQHQQHRGGPHHHHMHHPHHNQHMLQHPNYHQQYQYDPYSQYQYPQNGNRRHHHHHHRQMEYNMLNQQMPRGAAPWFAYGGASGPNYWYMQQREYHNPDMYASSYDGSNNNVNNDNDNNNTDRTYDEWGNATGANNYCGSSYAGSNNGPYMGRRGSYQRNNFQQHHQPNHQNSKNDDNISTTSSSNASKNNDCILLSTAEYNRLLTLAGQNHASDEHDSQQLPQPNDNQFHHHHHSDHNMRRRSSTGSFSFLAPPPSFHGGNDYSQRRGSIGADGLTRKERRRLWYAKYLQSSRRGSAGRLQI